MSDLTGESILREDGVPIAQFQNEELDAPEALTGEDGAADSRPIAHARGGAWLKYYNAALTNTKVAVKASSEGKLGGWHIYNTNASDVFVQIFDKATTGAVTLGTTVPDMVLVVPSLGMLDTPPTLPGISFSNGIVIAATTTRGGLTAPGAALLANLWYV